MICVTHASTAIVRTMPATMAGRGLRVRDQGHIGQAAMKSRRAARLKIAPKDMGGFRLHDIRAGATVIAACHFPAR